MGLLRAVLWIVCMLERCRCVSVSCLIVLQAFRGLVLSEMLSVMDVRRLEVFTILSDWIDCLICFRSEIVVSRLSMWLARSSARDRSSCLIRCLDLFEIVER